MIVRHYSLGGAGDLLQIVACLTGSFGQEGASKQGFLETSSNGSVFLQ